jgi:alpha-tubulin suppressor-like RCC1 family protein
MIPNIKAKAISCNGYFGIIIDLNDNVYSFGSNALVQLGLGNKVNKNKPTPIHV